jgi:subtilisin family serine protease
MSPTSSRRVGVTVCAAIMLVLATIGTPSAASAETADPWWFSTLHIADAHKKATGKGVTVAVIDTALDPSVPDLKGADIEFGAACLPDGAKSKPRIHDFEANHGTAMTTIIAGQGKGNAPGGEGITGIAPDATVRFYSYEPDPRQTNKKCDEADTIYLFEQAIEDGVDIISFSTTSVFGMEAVIDRAIAAGIVVVAGAGKPDEAISSPASLPGVVSVLSFDKAGRAWKNNPHMKSGVEGYKEAWEFGYPVISAPGVKVPAGAMDTSGAWTSAYPRTGTSDSTAMVSGLLALLKSAYPKATGNQLIQNLIHYPGSAKPIAWDTRFGFGAASITQMLRHDPTKWPDVNPLLKGPEKAIADFPAGSDTAKPQTPKPDRSPAAAAADNHDGGMPAWLWPTAAIALIIIVAAAVIAHRRRASSSVTTPSETPEGARS